MKKILLLVSIFCAAFSTKAQNNILCEDFTTYDSLTAASGVYHGFTVSYHSAFSYYTSTQSSGLSGPNSYKFGVDSATMITPDITGATYFNFWMKGNGTNDTSTFYIYDSQNGTNWTQLDVINPVNTTGMYRQYALNPGAIYVKFFYHKSLGNVAFDDFCATDAPVSVGQTPAIAITSVYPNPSTGIITINANSLFSNCNATVMNMLGVTVKSFVLTGLNQKVDLSSFSKGIYMIRCKSDKSEFTQRLILRD